MWELKTARDLRPDSIYAVPGTYKSAARKITGTVAVSDDVVTSTDRPLYAWPPNSPDTAVTLAPDTPLFILKCTCNGMGFISNRWVFTGECRCVHTDLPKTAEGDS